MGLLLNNVLRSARVKESSGKGCLSLRIIGEKSKHVRLDNNNVVDFEARNILL